MRQEPSEIIRVDNFTAAYDDQVILENLNFYVRSGEIFVILGVQAPAKALFSNI